MLRNEIWKTRILALLCAFVLMITACSKKTEENIIVAHVGKHQISQGAFARSYLDLARWTPVDVQDSPTLRKEHLNDMITRHFIAQQAIESNIHHLPGFKHAMKTESTAVIIHGLYEEEIGKTIGEIPEPELEEAYKRMNMKLHLRHLVSTTKPGIDSLYNRLQHGENFERLARECFRDSTLRATGGDLGYNTWNDLDIDLENAAFALKVGETSKPIESKYGWHILKLENLVLNPILREMDFQIRKKSIENTLRDRLLKDRADKRIKQIIDARHIRMNVPLIIQFEKARRRLNKNLVSKLDSVEILNATLNEMFEIHKEEIIASYDGGVWTVGDFRDNLYTISPVDFNEGIYRAVAMTLRNHFLLSIAKEKRINRVESVKNKIDERRENLLADAYLDVYADTCTFNDNDLLYYYEQMKDKKYYDKKMQVLEILVHSETTAWELIHKINAANKDEKMFRELARYHTIRPGMKEKDGYLGIIGKNDYGEIGRLCFNSSKGGLMGPIKSNNGYSIVMVLDYEKVYLLLGDVKDDILKFLNERKRSSAFQKLQRQFADQPDIVVHEEILLNAFN